MTLYIIIILVTVLILGILFGRKRSDEKSDYQPEQFRHSGHDWVFNGILDIDHPPHDDSPFHDYDQPIQLMVKKGYVHCDITIDDTVGERDLGLFRAVAVASDDSAISILREGRVVAYVSSQADALRNAIIANGGQAEAYGFIAAKGQPMRLFGEVCIARP
jgi:hypothetical protein